MNLHTYEIENSRIFRKTPPKIYAKINIQIIRWTGAFYSRHNSKLDNQRRIKEIIHVRICTVEKECGVKSEELKVDNDIYFLPLLPP